MWTSVSVLDLDHAPIGRPSELTLFCHQQLSLKELRLNVCSTMLLSSLSRTRWVSLTAWSPKLHNRSMDVTLNPCQKPCRGHPADIVQFRIILYSGDDGICYSFRDDFPGIYIQKWWWYVPRWIHLRCIILVHRFYDNAEHEWFPILQMLFQGNHSGWYTLCTWL